MVHQKFMILNQKGLHLRPCSLFVSECVQYKCEILIESDIKRADAKSILEVYALNITCGDEILIICDGTDERIALQNIADFFRMQLPVMDKNSFMYV